MKLHPKNCVAIETLSGRFKSFDDVDRFDLNAAVNVAIKFVDPEWIERIQITPEMRSVIGAVWEFKEDLELQFNKMFHDYFRALPGGNIEDPLDFDDFVAAKMKDPEIKAKTDELMKPCFDKLWAMHKQLAERIIGLLPGGKLSDDVKVIVVCKHCGTKTNLQVPRMGLIEWVDGALIQNALPGLDAGERELLKTGTCGGCFDKIVKGEL